MKKIFIPAVLLIVMIFIAGACSEQNNDEYGNLRIYITDAPFPIEFIESANVIITKVEARVMDAADEGAYITLLEDTLQFNLLELRNGITEKMIDLDIPAGDLDLIRLYVDEASLSLTNGESYSVKVPSGQQTGIKVFIDPALTITGGIIAELLLDFNLEKSFVLKGNMNTPAGISGFNFKPVIRAINRSTSGAVSGTVTGTDIGALPNASVWIEQDTLVATTFTDSTGYYAIPALPAGTYEMSATKVTFDTVLVEEVIIHSANLSIVDFHLTSR